MATPSQSDSSFTATIVAITVADPLNPTEVQTWIDNNPTVAIIELAVSGNTFYILYE
jgi:hypothetical protein